MKPLLVTLSTLLFLLSITGCNKTDDAKSVSERIRQTWITTVIQENSVTVYTKGAINTIKPGYAQFKLEISNPQQQIVRLTEVDNATFVGTWALSADNKKLMLNDLVPQPTGTKGAIEYTIEGDPTETSLILVRQSQNVKTGNTVNRYELTRQL